MRSLVSFVLLVFVRIAVSDDDGVRACAEIEKRFKNEANDHKQPVCVCAEKGLFNTFAGVSIECESASISTISDNLQALNGTVVGGLTIRDSTISILPADIFMNVFPRHLKLERCGISSIDSTTFNPAGDTLEYISLRENRIKMLEKPLFAKLRKIRSIDLAFNKISVIEEGVFDRLDTLEQLLLNGNNFEVLTTGMFKGLKSLKRLTLESCGLKTIQKGAFRGLENLEQLILSNNELEDVDWSAFASLKSLRVLDLGTNKLRNVELKSLPKLEKIVLNNNEIDTMKAVKLRDLPSLAVAMIDRNKIETLGDMDMVGLAKSERLETLSLAYNNISKVGPKTFQHVPNLIVLLLANNKLTELSTDSVPFLAHFRKMVTLQISANNLTIIRAGELPKSLINMALDHNSIARIEPRALEGLALKRIYLHSNKLQFLYQGAFDSFSPSSVEAIDVSLNNWQCVCKDPKEWLPRWLAAADESDVSEGPVGCLAIPGCGSGDEEQEFEEEEEVVRASWITITATLLTVVTIIIMVCIALLYFRDHRSQFALRGRRCDSDLHKLIENDPLNLPTDSILVVPAMPKRQPTTKKSVRFDQNY